MNKLKYICALIIYILILSIAGCSHVESYLDVAKDKGISRKYLDVLDRWTRKGTLYSQFETKVQISATCKSEAFNAAYIEEYARIYYLTDGERKRMDDLQAGFARDFTEFFFYASMSQKEANDFDNRNSSWSIFLIDEKGNRIKPLDVRKIEKIAPVMEEFFPYINKYYGSLYSLKFPPAAGDGKTGADTPRQMKLVIAGVMGTMELTWP